MNLGARHASAEVLRHYATGVISTREYERGFFSAMKTFGPHDDAVWEVFHTVQDAYSGLWWDAPTLPNRRDPEVRRVIARCVLMLRNAFPVCDDRFVENPFWPFRSENDMKIAAQRRGYLGRN